MQITMPTAEWTMNHNEQVETSAHLLTLLMNKEISKVPGPSTIIH